MSDQPPRPLDIVERWMQAVITHPLGVEAGVASEAAQREIALDADGLPQVIERSQSLDSVERLSIYANAYYARLMECLTDEFPVLAKLVGEDAFNDLAFGYLQAHPSRSYTLGRLGENFASYLDNSRPPDDEAGNDWVDLLVELARLEWTFNEVFDGPGSEGQPRLDSTTIAQLGAERWPQARLTITPSLRLLELRFPVNALYTAVRDEQPFELPPRQPAFLAVSRREFIVERHELDRAAFVLLNAIAAGSTVEQAIAQAADQPGVDWDELARSLQRWFEHWMAAGLFTAVDSPAA